VKKIQFRLPTTSGTSPSGTSARSTGTIALPTWSANCSSHAHGLEASQAGVITKTTLSAAVIASLISSSYSELNGMTS